MHAAGVLTTLLLCYSTLNNALTMEVAANALSQTLLLGKNNWLVTCGNKQYYLGIFFQTNYYSAAEYCRYHGMNLATVDNTEEDLCLQQHLNRKGPPNAHYWIGASDDGHEGTYVWRATGRPVQYTNWHNNEPNNLCPDACENCLTMWYQGTTRRWNDLRCGINLYFVCECPDC